MDFINGLDDHKHAGFKVDSINDIGQGSMKVPATLNEMYTLASQKFTLRKCGTQQTLNVTCAAQADKLMHKRGIGNMKKSEKEKNAKKKMPTRGNSNTDEKPKKTNMTNSKACASTEANMDTMHTSAHTKMKNMRQRVIKEASTCELQRK
jgi:hypothetical protein